MKTAASASHGGVDPLALGRAALQFVTQRPHRLRRLDHYDAGGAADRAAARALALAQSCARSCARSQIERQLSKDEILDLYLALAPFGGNLEGVRAASIAYFGKEPKRLSLAEAALLVALPQSPEAPPARPSIRKPRTPRATAC